MAITLLAPIHDILACGMAYSDILRPGGVTKECAKTNGSIAVATRIRDECINTHGGINVSGVVIPQRERTGGCVVVARCWKKALTEALKRGKKAAGKSLSALSLVPGGARFEKFRQLAKEKFCPRITSFHTLRRGRCE
jgi:hypothetical protein